MRGDAVHLSHHGQRKTILIVDDDADLRSALAEQLELHEEFAAAEAGHRGRRRPARQGLKAESILLRRRSARHGRREVCRMMRKAGCGRLLSC
jgi:CheY-like chemotaxis protein